IPSSSARCRRSPPRWPTWISPSSRNSSRRKAAPWPRWWRESAASRRRSSLKLTRDRSAALAWLALGAWAYWAAGAYPAGTLAQPGPGFVPRLLAVLLIAAALLLMVQKSRPARPMDLSDARITAVIVLFLGAATFALERAGYRATVFLFLLAGVYYGAMYGGSTTSILMRIPGEAASVMTCIDGYAMTQKGRAGPALAIAAIGSFIAGTVSVVGLMLLAPPIAAVALKFGPPEYAALLTLGLLVLAYLSSGSTLKMLLMALVGLLVGLVGIDQMSGFARFTWNVPELADGVGVVPVAVGLFGISEIMLSARSSGALKVQKPRLADLVPSREEMRASAAPIARGTLIGFLIGVVPGSAHIISSFVSYALEKKISKHPERFGHGAVEGVAGPESANNSATSGAFIPLLALGIPSGAVPAVMLAALMIHGISPGPQLMQSRPDIFWGFIASMYVGNVVLLILNLPMVGLFVNLLRIPYAYLYPF